MTKPQRMVTDRQLKPLMKRGLVRDEKRTFR